MTLINRTTKYFNYLSVLAILLMTLCSESQSSQRKPAKVYCGIMNHFFIDVNIYDAKMAMEKYSDMLMQEYNKKTTLQIDYNLVYFDDISELINSLNSDKLDMVIITAYDYVFYNLDELLEPLVMDKPDERLVKVLVVNKNSNIESISDLKSKKISVGPNIEGMYSSYWLNMIAQKNGIRDYNSYFSFIDTCRNSKVSIMDLFFDKTDAAITSLFTYNTNLELNPQMKLKTKVIYKSEPLVYSLACVKKGTQRIDKKVFVDISMNVMGNKPMESLLELYKKSSVFPYTKGKLGPIEDLVKYSMMNSVQSDIKINKKKKK